MGDLGKLIVAKGFKKWPKVQKIAQSGHTAYPHISIGPWKGKIEHVCVWERESDRLRGRLSWNLSFWAENIWNTFWPNASGLISFRISSKFIIKIATRHNNEMPEKKWTKCSRLFSWFEITIMYMIGSSVQWITCTNVARVIAK